MVLINWLIDWLIDSFSYWLIDWLIDWLSWRYAEAYENFKIDPAPCWKNPIKKWNCHTKLSFPTSRREILWNKSVTAKVSIKKLSQKFFESAVDIRKKMKLNLILTNPQLFIIYWTYHHLFWFRFLKLLLIILLSEELSRNQHLEKSF